MQFLSLLILLYGGSRFLDSFGLCGQGSSHFPASPRGSGCSFMIILTRGNHQCLTSRLFTTFLCISADPAIILPSNHHHYSVRQHPVIIWDWVMLEPQQMSTITQVAALHPCFDRTITRFFYSKPTNICSIQNGHPCSSESWSELNGGCSLKVFRVYPEKVSQTAVSTSLLTLTDFPVSPSNFLFFEVLYLFRSGSSLSHHVLPYTVLSRRHASQREPSFYPQQKVAN